MFLTDDVRYLPGVGEKTAQRLYKLGIRRLKDFLTFFPRDYEDRSRFVTVFESALAEGKVCVRGVLKSAPVSARISGGKTMVKATVCDDTGSLDLVFFNQPYVKDTLKTGKTYAFFGKVEVGAYGRKSMVNPLFEEEGKGVKLGSITPVYRGTQGLSQNVLRAGAEAALFESRGKYEEPLPGEALRKYRLCPPEDAFRFIHKPENWEEIKQARRRLIYEELFMFCLTTGVLGRREKDSGVKLTPCDFEEFFGTLPYKPTGAQRRAVLEASRDMCSGERMNRLLQGDVGSGKTLVAAALAFLAVKNHGQAVIMAPTEILANQHYINLTKMFEPLGINCEKLVSDMTAAQKRQALSRIKSGEAAVICGTHALIQQSVEYKNPYLFVVDEQHRFGVRQRAALSEKAGNAHFMVMSATPIPRTLTLILYGDLSLSVLDERPPGRKPVQTFVVPEEKRRGMYNMIRDTVKGGGQVYVVCPLIEEGEDAESDEKKAAVTLRDKMQKALPGLRIGLMHSKLKPAEKDATMGAFSKGDLDVLVSTTVVEVGTDVPNASIMVIENAELFGLSQLHQLRGRVGRGAEKSYCIMISDNNSDITKKRLSIMTKTNDGFK
ncbi:MAG: ATP-dependent DNA helicase RecG, partial [Clostridia bacterium]|nr:ATP-dependent DNA helicase RecG [Clostridia bacterium]